MFCTKCGREYQIKCNCLNPNEISRIETLLLFFFVMAVPAIVNMTILIYQDFKIDELNYLLSGSLSLSIIVTTLLLLYFIFNKKYIILFFSCHQRTTRSFSIKNKYFILCARCTGILMGIYLTVLLTLTPLPLYFYFLLGLPIVIDGTMQIKTKYTSNNLKRFITGLLFAPTLIVLFSLFHYYLISLSSIIYSAL